MAVARYLVQGADVWLNTPRRPREASGTSGMKATANGVLNLSILDGWWDEGYTPVIGWAIGRRESYQDHDYQDQIEAEALYGLLEQEVVPLFYDRGVGGLPQVWINRMKASIQSLCQFFNTHRMVGEYAEKFYIPVSEHFINFTSDGMQKAIDLASWKSRVKAEWHQVKILDVSSPGFEDIQVGGEFEVKTTLQLGGLGPEDVAVQLYMGPVDPHGEIITPKIIPLNLINGPVDGEYYYQTRATACDCSGLFGYTVRVLPHHPDLVTPFIPGMITWAP
jgi:starch phosphorylase